MPIAAGPHPVPFRTRQLSPPAPMVAGQRSRESRSVPATFLFFVVSLRRFLFWAIVCAFLFLVISCKGDRGDEGSIRVSATGSLGEVVVVVGAHDTGFVKSLLSETIARPYLPLGPIEPSFDVHLITPYEWGLSGVYRRFRNIVFVHRYHGVSVGDRLPVCDYIDHSELDSCEIVELRDVWAKGQVVYVLTHGDGGCIKQLLDMLEYRLRIRELKGIMSVIAGYKRELALEGELKKVLGVEIIVPAGFKKAYLDGQRAFLRKDEGEKIFGLILYVFDNALEGGWINFIEWRDSVVGRLIFGPFRDDHMITDTLLYWGKPIVGDTSRIEVVGLWRLKRAFMGGPFVGVVDTLRGLYAEGFIFSPGERKRYRLKELEAIVLSARVVRQGRK